MVMRGDDDDTSSGRVTQGGHRDAGSPGPARRSGNSFLWFAAALVVAAVVAIAWIGLPSDKSPAARPPLGAGADARDARAPRLPVQALSP